MLETELIGESNQTFKAILDGIEEGISIIDEDLKIIIEECQIARDIIQRLLRFSRPSKGETKEKVRFSLMIKAALL